MEFKQKSLYTDIFKKDGQSKYGDIPIQYRCAPPDNLKISPQNDGSLIIEGWASTTAVDSYNEIVASEAFNETMPEYVNRFNSLMLYMHDWWGIAIGKILSYEVKAEGLWVKARISATELGKDLIVLIKDGVLRSFSIGFRPIKYEDNEETGIRTYTKIQVMEISIVNVPANPLAHFSIAKYMAKTFPIYYTNESSLEGQDGRTGGIMPNIHEITALETRMDGLVGPGGTITSAVDKAQQRLDSMKKTMDDLHAMQKLSIEQVGKLESGAITKSDFKTFADKVEKDLKAAMDELQSAKAASKLVDGRIHYKDWKKSGGQIYLRNDSGQALPDIHQKAYHYFQERVDYKTAPDGEFLKRMRDCHDTVLLTYAYMMGRHHQCNIRSLKSFEILHGMMEYVDPEFAKAMYSAGTGLGDEWVPTLMSAELIDLFRLESALENYFPHFNMPSNPYIWPIKSSGATAYIASEASVNTPTEKHMSNIGTSALTFTAKIHAVAVPCSPELIEDSIIDMVGEIRREIVTALQIGMEDALINGDTTATHRDTTTVPAASSDDIARAFIGLRFKAIDDSMSWDTQSTTANVGDAATTFTAPDVRYCRQLLGILGVNPRDCVYLTSITPFFYILSMTQFAKANEFGYTSTWYSGLLPIIDGSELYVSSKMPETMGTTGLCNSASTHKGILCFNKTRGFKIGERRGITVEFEKNIRTQQWTFVATRRVDFQKAVPSTRYPVSFGYNIE